MRIYYPWHPLRGQDLRVRRRMQMPSGEYIFSEFPDGTIGGFPAWMTDPAIGSVCSAGSGRPSAAALAELRALLDSVRTGSLVGSAFLEETPLENPHAIQENQGLPQLPLLFHRPAPIPLTTLKQRDLTAALADLLLHAAAVPSSALIEQSQQEVEHAS